MTECTCGTYGADSRNIVDWYKNKCGDHIAEDLEKTRSDLIVVAENISYDFHKGNILRTAEGFNIRDFWIVGNKRWDRRSAVGCQNRLPPKYAPDLVTAFKQIPDDYTIVTLDNVPGARSMYSYTFKPKTVIIVGEEGRGVSQEAVDLADDVVEIPMNGAVRSLSVSTAAGIAMGFYQRQVIVGYS